MTNQSVSPEKKSPQGRLSNELQDQREGIGIVWYLVLIMYLVLMGSTAYITFFDNNGFASHESNMNYLKELNPGDELNLFKELVEDEVKSNRSDPSHFFTQQEEEEVHPDPDAEP